MGAMSSAPPGKLKARDRVSKKQAARALEILRVPDWSSNPKLDWLVHGFSTRAGGLSRVYSSEHGGGKDLNLGFTDADQPQTVEANRQLFLEAVCGADAARFSLVTVKQIHSAIALPLQDAEMGASAAGPAVVKADGLMTAMPGLLLAIQTADCLPVLVADTAKGVVAAFHAGWRGTLARIVEKGVGRMRMEFGSDPKDLIAALGPGIGPCCYAVGEEVKEQFDSQFPYSSELFCEVSHSDPVREKYPLLFLTARAPGHANLSSKLHLDIPEANRRQLLAAGLRPSAIYLSHECTGCHTDRFFSYRNEHGKTGRMLSVIGIAPPLRHTGLRRNAAIDRKSAPAAAKRRVR
jgi:polyphenol oxidase